MCLRRENVHRASAPCTSSLLTPAPRHERCSEEAQGGGGTKGGCQPTKSFRELILLVLPKMGPTFYRSMLRATVKTIDPVKLPRSFPDNVTDKDEWKAACWASCRRRTSSPTMSR